MYFCENWAIFNWTEPGLYVFIEISSLWKNTQLNCYHISRLIESFMNLSWIFHLIIPSSFYIFLFLNLVKMQCRYMHRPVMSCPGLYDPTAIMNTATLDKCQREGWAKLAFYLLSFFYYIYGYDILNSIKSNYILNNNV